MHTRMLLIAACIVFVMSGCASVRVDPRDLMDEQRGIKVATTPVAPPPEQPGTADASQPTEVVMEATDDESLAEGEDAFTGAEFVEPTVTDSLGESGVTNTPATTVNSVTPREVLEGEQFVSSTSSGVTKQASTMRTHLTPSQSPSLVIAQVASSFEEIRVDIQKLEAKMRALQQGIWKASDELEDIEQRIQSLAEIPTRLEKLRHQVTMLGLALIAIVLIFLVKLVRDIVKANPMARERKPDRQSGGAGKPIPYIPLALPIQRTPQNGVLPSSDSVSVGPSEKEEARSALVRPQTHGASCRMEPVTFLFLPPPRLGTIDPTVEVGTVQTPEPPPLLGTIDPTLEVPLHQRPEPPPELPNPPFGSVGERFRGVGVTDEAWPRRREARSGSCR